MQRRARGDDDGQRMHAHGPDPRRHAERERVRGVSSDGRPLGPPAALSLLRPRRLLRLLEEQARDEALPRHGPPDHPVLRAGGGLGLVLRRRGDAGVRIGAGHSLAPTGTIRKQIGAGHSSGWPAGVSVPRSGSTRKKWMLSELWLPAIIHAPEGSRAKLRGFLPPVAWCPAGVSCPVSGSMRKMAMLSCPRLEP